MSWKFSGPSLILMLSILLLFSALSFAATPVCIVPPTGLVSWWTGDSDASDLYGVNDPSAVNAVSLVPGEVVKGFAFGTGSYIDILPSPTLENQKFTWDAWVRPDGPGPNNDQFGSVIVQQGIDSNDVAVSLWWTAVDDRFRFGFGAIQSETIASQDQFPAGSFYFVAATYDGATFRLYVNGVLEGSFAKKKTIPYSSRTFEVGSADSGFRGVGFPRTFNGVIDEVEAFKVALSAAKINAIFKAGQAGKCRAAVIVLPANKTFAAQPVGVTSAPKAFTVTNNRNGDLALAGVTLTGTNPTDFAESSTTCGSTLPARTSCKVNVTFTAGATGRRSAVLNVNDGAVGSPQTVGLKGTGQ